MVARWNRPRRVGVSIVHSPQVLSMQHPLYRVSRAFSSSVVLSFALASAGCSAGHHAEPEEPESAAPAVMHVSPALRSVGSSPIADVVEGVLPSVVSVRSTQRIRANSRMGHLFGRRGSSRPQTGLGSGVILSAAGLIVTNHHVIAGADTVTVVTHDEREFKARVVGADPKSDIAVLQLEGVVDSLIPILVGDSSALRLGDVVLAVGNPFGVGQTVTMGIVSATGRADMGIVDYENFIQTDAAINPGNSGGALINMQGQLVGINTAILSRGGGSVGIGFAIPTNMAAPIVDALRSDGKVTRGWLGVRIQELDPDLSDALALGSTDGILIADVQAEGPADEGGLKSGDVVTHVGKNEVRSAGQFRNLIASTGADTRVVLGIIREGAKKELSIDLGTLPDENVGISSRHPNQEKESPQLEGLALKNLDAPLRQRLSLGKDVRGAVIVRVSPGSKAAHAKLRRGDVIIQINHQTIASARQAVQEYQATKNAKLIQIIRDGAKQFVVIK